MNYAVIGASGHIGQRVAEALLEQKHTVRVVARTAAKLAPLAQRGAEVHAGDIGDAALLTRVFDGVGAVYVMLPPNLSAPDPRAYAGRLGAALAAALQAAGVCHVVSLSSVGADRPDKTGPIAGLHDQEERLNRLAGLNVVHLRAAFFMENLLQHIATIQTHGLLATPLRGDLPLPMIATRDIARAAAAHLLALDFQGPVVHDLLGPRDVTLQAATAILGKAIGQPKLTYQQAPYAQGEQAMIAGGIAAGMAHSFIEMYRAFNEGLIVPPPRTAANTTPTTLEVFAAEFAELFRSRAG